MATKDSKPRLSVRVSSSDDVVGACSGDGHSVAVLQGEVSGGHEQSERWPGRGVLSVLVCAQAEDGAPPTRPPTGCCLRPKVPPILTKNTSSQGMLSVQRKEPEQKNVFGRRDRTAPSLWQAPEPQP